MLFGTQAQAAGWRAVISQQTSLPSHFLAVDKSKQELFFYEQHSPVTLVHKFPCTTGQVEGDKAVEGDLRTPEGIYFTERKLEGEWMDYGLYGDLAFTLNYPNPVDRIRGKTGHGIWIHGRGHSIIPRETKGCVALNTPDLHALSPLLALGRTPVAIAREVTITQPDASQDQLFSELRDLIQQWKMAWQKRSPEYFSFYDPQLFARSSGTSFNDYVSRKTEVFSKHPWIDLSLNDVRILAGPGYWVTWFGQFFLAPGFRAEGIKRLYWQKDSSQQFKIVGSEWVDANLGLEEQYFQDVEQRITAWLQTWRHALVNGNLEEYLAFYAEDAVHGDRRGRDSLRTHLKDLWETMGPKSLELGQVTVVVGSRGFETTFRQTARALDGSRQEVVKTLILQPVPEGFRIVDEQWRSG